MKIASIIITVALIISSFIIFSSNSDNKSNKSKESSNNVKIIDGIQYITVNARGGYTPRISQAKSDIPTKLIVKTNGTYDCSQALVIRSINYNKILSPTGEEVIDLGNPKSGSIQGMCSMGMYNFNIKFK